MSPRTCGIETGRGLSRTVGEASSTFFTMASMIMRWAWAREKSPPETAWRSRAKARASSPFRVCSPASMVSPLVSE